MFPKWRLTYPRRYLPCFLCVAVFAEMAYATAVVQLEVLISRVATVDIGAVVAAIMVASGLLGGFIVGLSYGRISALRYLVGGLMICLAIACITLMTSQHRLPDLIASFPVLMSLYLINTYRFQGFCRKMMVFRIHRAHETRVHSISAKRESRRIRNSERR